MDTASAGSGKSRRTGWAPTRCHRSSALTGAGEPTQRYYRIPSGWLRRDNRLVFFSETGAKPAADSVVCRPYAG